MPHKHSTQDHVHGIKCGHTAIRHGDHVDYLHDGHLHHQGKNEVIEEHVLVVAAANPATCTGGHECNDHSVNHVHGSGCGHEAVPHGDHVDYLVDGHLHPQHSGNCDNHGSVFFG